MSKYTVTTGQNLLDVALHIYGSIEGIVDLMMNNLTLSLSDTLQAGDQLEYTDDFIINPDIVAYYKMNNIIPANGERRVYYKPSTLPKVFSIRLSNKKNAVGFCISGAGKMEIDWGDNAPLQVVTLENELQKLDHSFDNAVSKHRKIILYGDFTIKQADFTDFQASSILLFRPVSVEEFILNDSRLEIGFVSLFQGVYRMNLAGLKTTSLLPLVNNKELMQLDLSNVNVLREVLDEYLKALVHQYYGRRSCTILLTDRPSGEYREPGKDENGHYILSCGMEAVWVLCNEVAWNEGGYWKIGIGNEIYTTER